MHWPAVVALLEILNYQLPVGLYFVRDGLASPQFAQCIACKRLERTKTFDDRAVDLRLNGSGIIGEVKPDQSVPDFQRHRYQTKGGAIKLLIGENVRRAD